MDQPKDFEPFEWVEDIVMDCTWSLARVREEVAKLPKVGSMLACILRPLAC